MSATGETRKRLLGDIEMLDGLGAQALNSLAEEVRWVEAPAGSEVITEGAPSSSVLFVVQGRLRALGSEPSGEGDQAWEIGVGQPVGELGLLLDRPRSASAVAIRDSLLAELDREGFERVITRHPEALLPLSRRIAARLVSDTPRRKLEPASTLVAGTDPVQLSDPLWTSLSRELEDLGAQVVTTHDLIRETGRGGDADPMKAARWLESRTRQGHHVFVRAEARPSSLPLAAIVDRTLLVAGSDDRPGDDRLSGELMRFREEAIPATVDLMLLRDARSLPERTGTWLEQLAPRTHHHVRVGNREDLQRLARRITGRSTALVLGGGGARAFVHVGAVRAIREAGLAIDSVTGTSFGAVVGAQLAMGWSTDRMLEENARAWGRLGWELNLPFVSLLGGRALRSECQDMFGDRHIEDLPLELRCLTTDLSWCRPTVHTTGPLRRWLRATTSMPGVHPPVVHAGRLHVDGGIFDHVPVGPATATNPGTIIAVDPSPFRPMPIHEDLEEAPGGLGYLIQRIPLVGTGFPGIVSLMYRAFAIQQQRAQRDDRRRADLYIEPPVDRYRVTDYRKVGELAEFGYVETARRLERDGHRIGV